MTCPGLAEGVVRLEGGWGVGPEGSEPGAVDASVNERDRLTRVEDDCGAGGELSIEENAISRMKLLIDGECEAL